MEILKQSTSISKYTFEQYLTKYTELLPTVIKVYITK